jgi:hypothetical protein
LSVGYVVIRIRTCSRIVEADEAVDGALLRAILKYIKMSRLCVERRKHSTLGLITIDPAASHGGVMGWVARADQDKIRFSS